MLDKVENQVPRRRAVLRAKNVTTSDIRQSQIPHDARSVAEKSKCLRWIICIEIHMDLWVNIQLSLSLICIALLNMRLLDYQCYRHLYFKNSL